MNILTFDIEDWFHILDNFSSKTEVEWRKYPSRVESATDMILEVLSDKNLKATFFCLGWIATEHPGVIKKIMEEGHEIGSHSQMHQLAYEQTPAEFREDIYSSIQILESITGKKIMCYRAPGFSITEKNKWAFEILYEQGIRFDSSVFPASRNHGGYRSINYDRPFRLSSGGNVLHEFPINTTRILNKRLIFSGGGYFRLLPYSLIKEYTRESEYVMTYFHPRDFDGAQPLLPGLSYLRRFKSYYGIKDCLDKFKKYLDDFQFMSLEEAEKSIDWTKTPVINI